LKLPNWLYETMPLVYFSLGFASAQIDYGQVSSSLFFVITFYVHVSRYNNRQRINKARKYGNTKTVSI